ADLVAVLGKREIKKALGTADARKALERVRQESARVDRLFAEARRVAPERRLQRPTGSDAEITSMVCRWWGDRERPAVDGDLTSPTEADLEEVLSSLEFDESWLLDRDDLNTAAATFQIAEQIMRERGLSLHPVTQQHALARELVRRGLIEGIRQRRQRI